MIKKKLEGTILTGEDQLGIYKEYLDSYKSIFLFKTFSYMSTPVKDLIKNAAYLNPGQRSLSLIEAYTNYLVLGKLHNISNQYFNIGKRATEETTTLLQLLKGKGYDLEKLADNLVKLFSESYIEKIKYHLNKGSLVEISSDYNTIMYERSK